MPRRRVESLLRLGDALFARRDDLRAAFPSSRSPGYWFWLHWHGAESHPEIAEQLYPIPDQRLRDRVVGPNSDEQSFRRSGALLWRRFEGIFRDAGVDFESGAAVLDFGAGCARIIRFFGLYAGTCRCFGVDVDSEAVDWCNDNIDFASFLRIPFEPPTELPEATFDVVYANSVFSHLSEPRHLQWLEELHRITRLGAVLILTVQGERVIRAIGEERRQGVVPDVDEFTRGIDGLRERGFGFFPYRTLPRTAAGSFGSLMKWDLTEYGSAFVLEPYVRRVWSRYFEVLAWHAAPEDWQDFVVLRRL